MKFEEQNKPPVGFQPKTFSLTFETAEEYTAFRELHGNLSWDNIVDVYETDSNDKRIPTMFKIASHIYNAMDDL